MTPEDKARISALSIQEQLNALGIPSGGGKRAVLQERLENVTKYGNIPRQWKTPKKHALKVSEASKWEDLSKFDRSRLSIPDIAKRLTALGFPSDGSRIVLTERLDFATDYVKALERTSKVINPDEPKWEEMTPIAKALATKDNIRKRLNALGLSGNGSRAIVEERLNNATAGNLGLPTVPIGPTLTCFDPHSLIGSRLFYWTIDTLNEELEMVTESGITIKVSTWNHGPGRIGLDPSLQTDLDNAVKFSSHNIILNATYGKRVASDLAEYLVVGLQFNSKKKMAFIYCGWPNDQSSEPVGHVALAWSTDKSRMSTSAIMLRLYTQDKEWFAGLDDEEVDIIVEQGIILDDFKEPVFSDDGKTTIDGNGASLHLGDKETPPDHEQGPLLLSDIPAQHGSEADISINSEEETWGHEDILLWQTLIHEERLCDNEENTPLIDDTLARPSLEANVLFDKNEATRITTGKLVQAGSDEEATIDSDSHRHPGADTDLPINSEWYTTFDSDTLPYAESNAEIPSDGEGEFPSEKRGRSITPVEEAIAAFWR